MMAKRDDAGSPRVLVHLGYPKAASTFLQSTLFSGAHPEIGVLPSPENAANAGYIKSGAELFMPRLGDQRWLAPFDFSPEAARKELRERHDPAKPVTVISNEELAGHPYSGGVTAETIGQRIKQTAPDARILIVVREQRAMILSAYADFLVRSNGLASLRRFLSPTLLAQNTTHLPAYYHFSRLVRWYCEHFGRDDVLVLPMEVIVRTPDAALARICEFAGVSPCFKAAGNPRRNSRDWTEYAALRLFRILNLAGRQLPFNGYAALGMPGLRSAGLRLASLAVPRPVAEMIRQRDLRRIERMAGPAIAADNRVLQDFVEDDLSGLGYLVAAS